MKSATDGTLAASLPTGIDERTLDVLARRRSSSVKRRGALVRRGLVVADVTGLAIAFVLMELVFGSSGAADDLSIANEYVVFLATLPIWLVFAKLYRLYDHDEEAADHTTLEDLVGVFHLVTVGAFLLILGSWISGFAYPSLDKLAGFWAAAVVAITVSRAAARAVCRRSPIYLQNTVVVGAGDVGQLVARKLKLHGEYGINLVGFVDASRRATLRTDLDGVPVLGTAGGASRPRAGPGHRPRRPRLLRRVARTDDRADARRCATSTCRSTSCRACSRASDRT